MGYQVKQSIHEQIIHLRLFGEITMNDVFFYNQEVVAALRQNNGQMTHLLIDAAEITQFPGNLQSVRRYITYLNEPTLGWVVDWGNKNTNFYFITSVLNRMAGIAHASCATQREAVQRIDTTIRKKTNRALATITRLPTS